MWRLVVTMLLVLIAVNSNAAQVLLYLESGNVGEFQCALTAVKETATTGLHIYPPYVIAGDIELDSSIRELRGIRIIRPEDDISDIEVNRHAALNFIKAWQMMETDGRANRSATGHEIPALVDDVIYEENPVMSGDAGKELPYGADYEDTSLYMIGDVKISVITPESIGGSEDWDSDRLAQVYSEIMNAMDWWADREPNAGLNNVYVFEEQVPIPSEPIEQIGLGIWIAETMVELGYEGTTAGIYDYVNDQRDAMPETDWSFVVYVADSLNDSDGRFADGKFAFARMQISGGPGGPYCVMTYDNSGYGIENMDTVAAHETGHIFGAMDQYGSCTCTFPYGYLNYENQNCVNDCMSDVRGGPHSLDSSAASLRWTPRV